MPGITASLLSVSKLISEEWIIEFSKYGCHIKDRFNGQIVGKAVPQNNLHQYILTRNDKAHIALNNCDLWHQRLGHLGMTNVQLLANGMVDGIANLETSEASTTCVGCIHGKQHRQPFPLEGGKRATALLGIVHTDICGPMKTTSFNGAKYFLTFIDDMSRKTFVYFLKC